VSPASAPRIARGLGLFAVAAMAVYCATHMRIVGDISSFMPTSHSGELAALSRGLTRSPLTRQMVLSLGAPTPEIAVRAARALEAALAERPEIAWVRAGVPPGQQSALYQLYFPRRHYFASDDPEGALRARLTDEGLRASALRLRAELRRPSSTLIARIAGADPLLVFPDLLKRLTRVDRGLTLRDGVFTSQSGEHALLLLATRASPFDSSRQRPLLDAIDAEVAAIGARLGAPLVLESAGVNRFALNIEESIRGEIRWLFAASLLGTVLLFLAFFRSVRALLVAMLPHALGVLIAATVGLLLFGELNGLAVAFGVSLIGVSIDYSIHLQNHFALAPRGTPASEILRRLRPSLLLGGATTVVSLVGLAFGDFPGFYQMGLLATVGVASALLVSVWIVPGLLADRPAPGVSRRSAERLGRIVARLQDYRRPMLALPVVCALLALWGVRHIHWVDDLTELQRLDPELVAENDRVRGRLSHADATRFLVTEGDDVADALEHNDALAAELPSLVERGALVGFRSLHDFIWSESLQRRNLAVLREDPSLPERLARVYAEEGFRPESFAAFGASLADPPPPLRLEDLEESPLGFATAAMRIDLDGERVAIVTQLEDVRDAQAVAEAAARVPGARFFDQKQFFRDVYGEYRHRIVLVVLSGCLTVFGLLLLRYRAFRPALAAALPSMLVACLLTFFAAATATPIHILHLIGLILVMGMGVDYGIFVWDSAGDVEDTEATMQSLLLSALTTIFVFGVMGLSAHPVLHAIGRTTALGIALAFVLAPASLVLVGRRPIPRSG
jgi:predicted exporter